MHIHIHKHTEAPEASFLWDEDDRVQTPPKSALASVSPELPREPSLSHLHLLGLGPLAQALQQELSGCAAARPQETQAQGCFHGRFIR